MKLSVLFGGHVHPWEDLLDLVLLAEELGFAAAYVDGDICMLSDRVDAVIRITEMSRCGTRRLPWRSRRRPGSSDLSQPMEEEEGEKLAPHFTLRSFFSFLSSSTCVRNSSSRSVTAPAS